MIHTTRFNKLYLGLVAVAGLSSFSMAEAKTFTMATSHSARALSVQAMEHWKELMNQQSDGDLNMVIIPGGSLGSAQQLLQQLSTNEVQVNIGGLDVVHQLMKTYQCLEAEYVYEDQEHGYKVLTGELGQELSNKLKEQYNFSIVGVGYRGSRHVTANKPIQEPADLEGVKIRVTNPLRAQIFEAYGALPGPLPYSELYGGLRQGVFDAQENPIIETWDQKLYEVQETLNLTNHVQNYYLVTANQEFLNSLTDKNREIFQSTLDETMTWLNNKVKTQTDDLIQKMKDEGIQVVNPDVEKFRKIALPIVKDYAKENCRPGLLDDIESVK